MPPIKKRPDPAKQAAFLASLQRDQAQRQDGYRDRALSLFPHVCGRCGGESPERPARTDGAPPGPRPFEQSAGRSNWELLCYTATTTSIKTR